MRVWQESLGFTPT
jgi:hypothetical protein